MKRWWEEWPGRLEYELTQLEKAGIPYKRNDKAFEEGRFELDLSPTVGNDKINLIAKFSDLYPYFRFEIIAPDLNLPHHQNPFGKNLCLIGRDTRNWRVDDTLAQFINEKLPDVLRAGRSGDNGQLRDVEIPQGEPYTDYYEYAPGAILVDSSWQIPNDERRGKLTLGFRSIGQLTTGAVLEVHGRNGSLLAEAGAPVRRLFPREITAHWIRLGGPVEHGDGFNFAHAVFKHYPDLQKEHGVAINNQYCHVIGIIFPDELAYGKKLDAWVFVIRLRSPRNAKPYRALTYLVREARYGRADVLSRAPELTELAQKKVAVFGLGCVGAPSAIELARAGVGDLRLVDPDFVEAASTIRWPTGVAAVGAPKVDALREFIEANYPYTKVTCYTHQLGGVLGKRRPDLDILDEVLAEADLIYDATAEVGVQYFLSELARKRAIPYLMAWATTGAWGGLIASFVPGQTQGCWSCLERARGDKTLPSPPEKPGEMVQPLGCASPTFTGAGFDIAHVSLAGVRLAVGILSRGVEGGYAGFDWDVGILSLRTPDGSPIPPKWETFRLSRHPACEVCKDSH